MIGGLNVVESPWLLEDGEPEVVRRTWRQRLLSWPWRPWEATYIWVPKVPMRGAVMVGNHTLLVHPATLRSWLERGLISEADPATLANMARPSDARAPRYES